MFGLQVVKQCCGTDGVEPQYIKDEILPDFFKHFWQHRMALDRRNYRQVNIDHYVLLIYVCFGILLNMKAHYKRGLYGSFAINSEQNNS